MDVLREVYVGGGRKMPGAPTEFVPTQWRGYLDQAAKAGNATAYRHYWKLCTLLGLRDALRSGDVWVPGSRRYSEFHHSHARRALCTREFSVADASPMRVALV
ncbi:hypothetical protein [Saccharopolyspora sp. ASAGF58]|uniref:hypothetical protein n=1 Tax=Saccharopolyspora sp. ASAGF58 TaxID=2719023 RepID=UPI001B30FED1|nr:hypothetical protein [Saccharopolyspora sp. ASAGF58]